MVALLIVCAACGGGAAIPDAGPDAAPPDAGFRVRVRAFVSGDAGAQIAGEDVIDYVTVVDGEAAAAAVRVDVTGVYGGASAMTMQVGGDCDRDCGPGNYVARTEDVCIMGSGEVRRAAIECDSPVGGCVGDLFCRPRCSPTSCTGARCGLLHRGGGWLDCVAIGARAEGETCTIDAGGVDDCGDRLACVDGVCAAMCPCTVGVCTPIAGASPEVGVCR